MVYMAADNDLQPFALRNIKQMLHIGSTQHVSLFVYVNTIRNKKKCAFIYHIKKEELQIVAKYTDWQTNAANPATLKLFCATCLNLCNKTHTALIFWNHGTGILPQQKSISKQQFIKSCCFDDTSGASLSLESITQTLQVITTHNGKKFDIIGFDACLMSMLEVAVALEPCATHLVASQDIESAMGWDYARVLSPFLYITLTPLVFAKHMVHSYQKTYGTKKEFTLSCIHLPALLQGIVAFKKIQNILLQEIRHNNNMIASVLKKSCAPTCCAFFQNPSFLDVQIVFTNILENLTKQKTLAQQREYLQEFKQTLEVFISHIKKATTLCCPSNTKKNTGLSFYFPSGKVDPYYRSCSFNKQTNWYTFLQEYVAYDQQKNG